MRAFVGIDIADERIVSALDALRGELGVPAGPRQNHITLAFLGELDGPMAASAADALGSLDFGAFDAHIAGVGAFPSVSRPRVIWAGVREGAADLKTLARRIGETLEPLGIAPPGRLIPHVTVSRVKNGHGARRDVIREHRDAEFGSQRVASFSLKRSDPADGGHVHTILRTVEALA